MTFIASSLNYTHNISLHPLGWTWMFKVGPLPTFLSKKIKTVSKYFNATKRDAIYLKIDSGENHLAMVGLHHLTNFFQILYNFHICLEIGRNKTKMFFTLVEGCFLAFSCHSYEAKIQKSSFVNS